MKNVKMFDVTSYIIICDKLQQADELFKEFIVFYDPLKIIHINVGGRSILTEDGNIIFTREDPYVRQGRHTCIYLSVGEYYEFVHKYEEERRNNIACMSKLDKYIYNCKLKKHAKKNGSLKNRISVKAYFLR